MEDANETNDITKKITKPRKRRKSNFSRLTLSGKRSKLLRQKETPEDTEKRLERHKLLVKVRREKMLIEDPEGVQSRRKRSTELRRAYRLSQRNKERRKHIHAILRSIEGQQIKEIKDAECEQTDKIKDLECTPTNSQKAIEQLEGQLNELDEEDAMYQEAREQCTNETDSMVQIIIKQDDTKYSEEYKEE